MPNDSVFRAGISYKSESMRENEWVGTHFRVSACLQLKLILSITCPYCKLCTRSTCSRYSFMPSCFYCYYCDCVIIGLNANNFLCLLLCRVVYGYFARFFRFPPSAPANLNIRHVWLVSIFEQTLTLNLCIIRIHSYDSFWNELLKRELSMISRSCGITFNKLICLRICNKKYNKHSKENNME